MTGNVGADIVLASPGPILAPERARHQTGTALAGAFTFLLLSVTVLERFGLNFGSYSLNVALPAMYLVLLVAAFTGLLGISFRRVIAYLLCMAAAAASMMFNQERSSGTSLILLMTIYLPFVFVLTPSPALAQGTVTRLFVNIGLCCAIAGIVQYYSQFFIHGDWLFNFTSYIPAAFRGPSGFNTAIPVGAHYKSNGFFFREPSGFSFIMALSLLAEYSTSRRYLRVACFVVALLLTYSGTGLLALAIGMLVPFNRQTLLRLVALGLVAVTAFWLLDDALNLSFTVSRVNEFGSPRSSAYIRYIAPARLLADSLTSDTWSAWFGHGPGTITRTPATYEFHDPTWAKLVYEYGLVGFSLFQMLFVLILRQPIVPSSIRVVLFAGWLVMGGHLLSPEQTYLTLALVGMFPTARPPRSLLVGAGLSSRSRRDAAALQPVAVT